MNRFIVVVVLCLSISRVAVFDTNDYFWKKYEQELAWPCVLPSLSEYKTHRIYKCEDQPNRNVESSSESSKMMTVFHFQCNEGYLFSDGKSSSSSLCRPMNNGEWKPPIKHCLRICPSSRASNVELTNCTFSGRSVDCKGPLVSGTAVIPRCKPSHHVSPRFNENFSPIWCQNDGTWSRKLFDCDPDYDIHEQRPVTSGYGTWAPKVTDIDINVQEPETVGYGTWSQFPWHVAIYSRPRGSLLICGGTLVSSNVVLSAASCFYDEARGVPKTQPNEYFIKTLTHQETYEISEILEYEKPYNPPRTGYAGDIVLIILNTHVPIDSSVSLACFQSFPKRFSFNPSAGTEGSFPSWEYDINDMPTENVRKLQLAFIPYNECLREMVGVSLEKFCASTYGRLTIQPGAGGGGLVFKDPNPCVRGIASTTNIYGNKSLTTFTDITHYEGWINRVIQEKSVYYRRHVS